MGELIINVSTDSNLGAKMPDDSKRPITRKDAFELFGEMRYSTPEEQRLYREMLERHSMPLKPDQSIFDLPDKITMPNTEKDGDI